MIHARYTWKSSNEIEGLDDPMISPTIIPEGFQQYWDEESHEWRIQRRHGANDFPFTLSLGELIHRRNEEGVIL